MNKIRLALASLYREFILWLPDGLAGSICKHNAPSAAQAPGTC